MNRTLWITYAVLMTLCLTIRLSVRCDGQTNITAPAIYSLLISQGVTSNDAAIVVADVPPVAQNIWYASFYPAQQLQATIGTVVSLTTTGWFVATNGTFTVTAVTNGNQVVLSDSNTVVIVPAPWVHGLLP